MAHPGTSYVLDGRDSELKNHVGHKVEVTGTLAAGKDALAGSGTTSPTPSSPATASMASGAQHLSVTSVRMIASDCSAK